MLKKIESVFESALWGARLIMVVAVITSVLSAVLMIVLGVISFWEASGEVLGYFTLEVDATKLRKHAIVNVIASVDSFLIATVLLILGFGLYELFVSKIDPAERSGQTANLLIVRDLTQLEARIASVIIMVLVVAFLKQAMGLTVDGVVGLLGLAGGIVLCAGALFLVHRLGREDK
ncbi:MAG: YqhA family protein [Polyangiaceae bacterium]|nr:YqhA family protein [Polyangiaceae bacterium]